MATLRALNNKREPFSDHHVQRCRDMNKWFRDGNSPIAKGILECIEKMDFDLNKITISWFQGDDVDQEKVSFITKDEELEYSFYYNYLGAKPDQGQALYFQVFQIDKTFYPTRAALIVRNESKT